MRAELPRIYIPRTWVNSLLSDAPSEAQTLPCSPRATTVRSPPTLDPDIRGHVASGVTHLVGAGGSSGFFTEVHVEVLVDLHASLFGVAVDLEQVGALFGHLGVELVVPAAIERVGHIESLAIERELQHLRAALKGSPRGLLALAEHSAAPELAAEARV